MKGIKKIPRDKFAERRVSKSRLGTNMKRWFYAISVLIIVILSEPSWPIENPAVRSPVVSGTVPPTSFSSGLIQNPNPIDTSGNLIITGNVTGGKHFRGLVPYSSNTSFQGQLGTSSLDSFLRSSADSTDLDRYRDPSSPYYSPVEASTGGYRPFFSPTGTVTTTRASLAGTLTLANTRIDAPFLLLRESRVADDLALPALPDGQALADLDSSALQMSLWPTSRTPQEMEKLISDELRATLSQLSALEHLRSASLARNESRTGQYQDQMERYRPDLGRIDNKASLLKEGLVRDIGYSASEAEYLQSKDGAQRIINAGRRTMDERQGQQLVTDRFGDYERSKLAKSFGQRMDDLVKQDKDYTSQDALDKLREGAADKPFPSPSTSLRVNSVEGIEQDKLNNRYSTIIARKTCPEPYGFAQGKLRRGMGNLSDESNEPRIEHAPSKSQTFGERSRTIANLPRAQLKDRGSQIGRGISLSEDKYNFYLSAAQIYLKQGRYYRAVDSFTLASIYKPKDPLAYVGKSHALFAAGEYISSALFLSRAFEVMLQSEFEISNFKFEFPQDELNSRLADAEERLKISGAPELHFLLGYIYYQIDRIDAASKAINEAHKKLPSSRAVFAVKKVVDETMNRNTR